MGAILIEKPQAPLTKATHRWPWFSREGCMASKKYFNALEKI
jgi:hypothetical protein